MTEYQSQKPMTNSASQTKTATPRYTFFRGVSAYAARENMQPMTKREIVSHFMRHG